MICAMDKNREVSYPCFRGCPLFGDCVVNYELEQEKKLRINNKTPKA